MKRISTLAIAAFGLVMMPATAAAQDVSNVLGSLLGAALDAAVEKAGEDTEKAVGLPQQDLALWSIPAANYSGITPLGDGRYAVVSDKESADGFYIWHIIQDSATGKVTTVTNEGFYANKVDPSSDRDCEGVVFFPDSNTVFISGEGDQKILEYTLDGQRTGRELEVPEHFKAISPNYGFEALAFGGRGFRKRFWTTTESTLPADGPSAGPSAPGTENLLRLQSFGKNLEPKREYFYKMDVSRTGQIGSIYACGVPSICALPNRTLLVLEREANVPKLYVGADVVNKIYSVKPTFFNRGEVLEKKLIARWTTRLTVAKQDWANYEGMCLGIKLDDGRQTILLVNDSQAGYGKGPIRLHDYIKVLILED